MPFALLIIGAFLLIAAVRGKTDGPDGLFALVAGDFTGPGSYIYWMVAILIIGSIGYIPKAKPVTTAFLGLLILVLFLSKGDPSKAGGGFFEKFLAGIQSTNAPPQNNVSNATAGAAAQTLAPGQTGTQAVAQAGIQSLQSSAPVSVPAGTSTAITGLGSLANVFGSDFGGWVN